MFLCLARGTYAAPVAIGWRHAKQAEQIERHNNGKNVIQRIRFCCQEPNLIFEQKAHFFEVGETAAGEDGGLG